MNLAKSKSVSVKRVQYKIDRRLNNIKCLFINTKNVYLTSEEICKLITYNTNSKEYQHFFNYIVSFLRNEQKMMLKNPSDFFDMRCFAGNYAFKKNCVYCLHYNRCLKLYRFKYITNEIYQFIKSLE